MARPKKITEEDVGHFVRAYGRKRPKCGEPNDRHYSQRMADAIKRLKPEQLDQLLHDGDDAEGDSPPQS